MESESESVSELERMQAEIERRLQRARDRRRDAKDGSRNFRQRVEDGSSDANCSERCPRGALGGSGSERSSVLKERQGDKDEEDYGKSLGRKNDPESAEDRPKKQNERESEKILEKGSDGHEEKQESKGEDGRESEVWAQRKPENAAGGDEEMHGSEIEVESGEWAPSAADEGEESGEETLESEGEVDLESGEKVDLESEGDEEVPHEGERGEEENENEFPSFHPVRIEATQELQADFQRICATRVTYNGTNDTLREHCNFDLSMEGLPRAVLQPFTYVAHSPEQSNKTVGIAAVAKFAHHIHRPTVVIVKEVCANTAEVCAELNKILQPFEMEALYLRGAKKGWQDLKTEPFRTGCVRDGRLVLVLPAHAHALNHCASYLRANRIRDEVVIMDEADNFFSNSWTPEDTADWDSLTLTKAERALARIVGRVPGGRGSLVRSLVMFSASHLATVKWLGELQVPFQTFIADLRRLDMRGYALESDLHPAWFIESEAVTKATDYGFNDGQVLDFFKEVADPGPGRRGVLALIATTPRVWADGMNLFKLAAFAVTTRVRHGVAVVVCGRGIYVTRAALNPDPESIWGMEDGSPEGFQRIFHRRGASEGCRGRKAMMRQVSEVIQLLDDEHGLDVPIMVFGYNLVGRSCSLRSRERVLTHLAIALQKGRHTADLRQIFMRGAGTTRGVRARNGCAKGVRILCVREDYELVKEMFSFMTEVLRMTSVGPGQKPKIDWLKNKHYAPQYEAILTTQRPHARRTLGLTLEKADVRVAAESQEADVADTIPRGPEGFQESDSDPDLLAGQDD